MAKHKHREQEPVMNDVNAKNNNNINNTPFGIDPMQLIGLLGGNFDMNNMGNMLASMNTNGFNLNNLGPLAQMAGLNLDNNFMQGNNVNNNTNTNENSDFTQNMNSYPNNSNNINNNSNTNASNMNNKNSNNNSSKNIDVSKKDKKSNNIKTDKKSDDNLKFLMCLRSYVNSDKIKFIDKIIELYNSGAFKDI